MQTAKVPSRYLYHCEMSYTLAETVQEAADIPPVFGLA